MLKFLTKIKGIKCLSEKSTGIGGVRKVRCIVVKEQKLKQPGKAAQSMRESAKNNNIELPSQTITKVFLRDNFMSEPKRFAGLSVKK